MSPDNCPNLAFRWLDVVHVNPVTEETLTSRGACSMHVIMEGCQACGGSTPGAGQQVWVLYHGWRFPDLGFVLKKPNFQT